MLVSVLNAVCKLSIMAVMLSLLRLAPLMAVLLGERFYNWPKTTQLKIIEPKFDPLPSFLHNLGS